jgi:hypothetical protein
MIVLRTFIFCCSDASDSNKVMLCFIIFAIVISFCTVHFRDENSCIPRYMYDSFCKIMEVVDNV